MFEVEKDQPHSIMKAKLLFLFLLTSLFFSANAQENTELEVSQTASVEKSTSGIETGLLGVWGHNEMRLSDQIALRTEIGFNAGIWGGFFYPKAGFVLLPVITAEPRWYYNLEKRVRKSRDTSGNSANFISLQTSYHPDWFYISNYDNLITFNTVTFIPTWGIKRSIGEHFIYETAFGIGYGHQFRSSKGYEDIEDIAVNIHLRIGYKF